MADVDTLPLFATCARGTERALKYELKSAGVVETRSLHGAVSGRAPADAFGQLNVQSRIASRLLLGLEQRDVPTEDALVDWLREVPVERYLPSGATFAVTTTLRDAPSSHSLHVSRRVKDGIVDRFRDLGRARPDVDTKRPSVRFFLHWEGTFASLSLDTSGEPLHKRGYRRAGGEAPMKETLAAACLALAYADTRRPFVDPCCGSATLGIEQALRSLKRAPARGRPFAIDGWPADPFGLKRGLKTARARARDEERDQLEAPIFLSDWHKAAIAVANEQLDAAGLRRFVDRGDIELVQVDARDRSYELDQALVVSNLPFGERLGKKQLQLDGFYRTLGERLGAIDGARIILLSAHPGAERLLGLGRPRRWSLYSGQLPAMLRRWDIPDSGERDDRAPADGADDGDGHP